MEKEMFFKFVASYFYNKGHEDAKMSDSKKIETKNMSEYFENCKKAYKDEIDENRKINPHHHLNRLD
jgi:hypothetical protein